jgi:hypothetical protein
MNASLPLHRRDACATKTLLLKRQQTIDYLHPPQPSSLQE